LLPVASVASLEKAPAARQALERALQGYGQENLKPLETMLPPRFVGRSLLLDSARSTFNEQKQIRITLSDVRYSAGDMPPGSVLVSARWEKRFVKLPGLVPVLESGTLQASLHLEAGEWLIDALSPDNPLTR
jgi:hypothetical protein